MATLVFTALGTALGGPLGGALGSLIGNQIDQAIFGSPSREGPRLRELGVSTSSYGTAIALHYGTMRAPGTIIWSTDLIEDSEDTGGGKGQPSVTTYNYSVSLAVALSGRPIQGLGRIWADGNLLRGAAGDLKVGGELRTYLGYGDQPPDPLIASDRGEPVPAFRGLAYCVFESLQLADFGNRIPALTFEIFADAGEVSLAQLVAPLSDEFAVDRPLSGLTGFSNEGGTLAATLETVSQAYPISCTAHGEHLAFKAADETPIDPPSLPAPVAAADQEGFGAASGIVSRRQRDARNVPSGLRYYDTSRDYQAGVQRADGRARPGRERIIEFPGALGASTARNLANGAAERTSWAKESLAWRTAEIDPALSPGEAVLAPGRSGYWQIESWEWRDGGVELDLRRLPRGPARQSPADAGANLPTPDFVATPTEIAAYELPWDGTGSSEARQAYAAVSSQSQGWTGAALYLEQSGNLTSLGGSGSRRSIIGTIATDLTASRSMFVERAASVEVELISQDFPLFNTDMEGLANGANRAIVGSEVFQFGSAMPLGSGRWRLTGLLRGRGGTEAIAQNGHSAGTMFVLLDEKPVALDPAKLPPNQPITIAALGIADEGPVFAEMASVGATLRPLAPVHPHVSALGTGALKLQWSRRARGAWSWPDLVETPLNEQSEAYLVGLGDPASPILLWETNTPSLEIDSATAATMAADNSGEPIWVRQIGSFASSDPLLLTIVE